MDEELTIAAVVARCGLPESTLRKVRYWGAREVGDLDKAAEIADELRPVIRQLHAKEDRA